MKSLLKQFVVFVLTFEAKILLRRTKPMIIAVTGNVGKTSTKDAIYAALKDSFAVRKSVKSYNSELGVPLTILGLTNAWNNPIRWIKNMADGLLTALFPHEYPAILVLEMGVDRPGDMKSFTEWITPDVVVLTRFPDVPVHVEYFGTPEAVIAEKLELVHALKPDGVLVYNNDDEKIRAAITDVTQQTIGYSRYSQTDFAATQDVVLYEEGLPVGMTFTLSHVHTAYTVTLRGVVGAEHTYSVSAAAAVASVFDIPLRTVVTTLQSYIAPPGRMRLIEGIKKSTIIDDTYNASPVATERALATLQNIQASGRKIAVLGDMLELGSYSSDAHSQIGTLVPKSADILLTVGIRARKIAQVAQKQGMNADYIYQYDDAETAGEKLHMLIQPGDVVLAKASQRLRLEKLIALIMAEPDQSDSLLVRQSSAWKSQS